MTSDDIIKLVRATDPSQDEQLKKAISKTLEAYWNRGYEKRNRLELKLAYVRKRMRERFEEEFQEILEATAKLGYSGEWLKPEAYKRYLHNDTPISNQ